MVVRAHARPMPRRRLRTFSNRRRKKLVCAEALLHHAVQLGLVAQEQLRRQAAGALGTCPLPPPRCSLPAYAPARTTTSSLSFSGSKTSADPAKLARQGH